MVDGVEPRVAARTRYYKKLTDYLEDPFKYSRTMLTVGNPMEMQTLDGLNSERRAGSAPSWYSCKMFRKA